MAPTHQDENHGPLSEEAQMRVKYGATKGGLARSSDGDHPEPSEDDVLAKGGLSKEAQERIVEGGREGGEARAAQQGREGYQETGRKGGLATKEMSGDEVDREKGFWSDFMQPGTTVYVVKRKTKSEVSNIVK